jgi:aspartyl-tRNA(Asn)/glutamyl-tRNA(Gln) amidotransferase subunit A
MNKTDIPFLTVKELSALIKAREVSPVETAEAYLERIERIDPQLKAYSAVFADEAMATARERERDLAQGNYLGPMHGIPMATKDQVFSRDVLAAIVGSNNFFVPEKDPTVIAKLKEAGVILMGKTPFAKPTNPWGTNLSLGGSSTGSASGTAAFLCATALGEDTGGSLRGPASYCGIAGLRPSTGRVSRYGLMGLCWSMDVTGPMSRTVEDCAMTLQVIAGRDPKDSYTWNTPVPDYVRALDGDIKNFKVGVLKEMLYADYVDPEAKDAVLKATELMNELGAEVREVSLPLAVHDRAIASAIIYLEGSSVHHKGVRERLDDYDQSMRINFLAASLIPAQTYYKAQRLRAVLRQQALDLMQDIDLLVYPTMAGPATPLVDDPRVRTKDELKDEMFYSSPMLTSLANVVGAPSLSVPCGFSSSNLPLGLQIIGRPMEEETVFRLGHAYEQATEWHKRRPPL